jgi:MoxR-like ATPase
MTAEPRPSHSPTHVALDATTHPRPALATPRAPERGPRAGLTATHSVLQEYPEWRPSSPRAADNLHEAIEAFKLPFRRVTRIVISREPLAEAAALAVATHEHLLIHSKPGKAKSLFARSLFAQFEGAVYEKGFTDGTLEEEVVGGIEADKFSQGIVHRRTEGTLVTADWAFLDEFTRAQRGTWDVMLGILNEGIFRNGLEIEHARLHTAIAAANFLIATDRFLAVRDRFVYQATLADEDSRYAAIRIDQVHGRPPPPVPAEEKLPLAIPRRIAAIVLGLDPEYTVHLPYWVSFLKDDVIRRTARLARQKAQQGETIDDRLIYISSRTAAKAADALKASALLHHRFEVTIDDLPAARFAITTIAGDQREQSPGERIFRQALHEALRYYSEDDFHDIEDILHIADIYQAYRQGTRFEFKVLAGGVRNRVLTLLRHPTWEDVSEETCLEALAHIRPSKPEIEELKREVIALIASHQA